MNLKDVKKLSCADLNWLKNIENCGQLILPIYAQSNASTVPISEIMRAHNIFIRGGNEHKGFNLDNYFVTTRISIQMRLSECNSIIISKDHWGNWN